MICKDINDIKNNIGINKGFDFAEITPYLKRAGRSFIIPLIGKSQYTEFENYSGTNEEVLQAIDLAKAAESNFAYYLFLPIAQVQITTAGIFVAETDNAKAASDKNYKELQRSFKTSGHEALDDLLSLMNEAKLSFPSWTNDDSYNNYKELLVNSTSIFNKYYYIFNSYQTFASLVPTIRNVEDQFIKAPVQADLLTALKEDQNINERKEVKKLLQQSIVAFTVGKIVNNGMFVITPESLMMRFDQLPYEKTQAFDNKNEFLKSMAASKMIEGEEYLKQALKLIKADQINFSEYVEKETILVSKYIKTQSIVGI